MSVIGGLIVLVVVLAVASVAGAGMRIRAGRFKAGSQSPAIRTDPAVSPGPASPDTVLTAAELGAPLGERATLVQFSTEFCAYCGPTRELLAEVASQRDGVTFVEVDAVQRMDLTRRLRVLSTPTVLLLGADGVIKRRGSGKPRKSDLLAEVGAVLDQGGS